MTRVHGSAPALRRRCPLRACRYRSDRAERQRLGQARRASGQIPVGDASSTRTGQLPPVDHFPGPHEHPVGDAHRTADQVRTPMHPIREVDIQSPDSPNITRVRGVGPLKACDPGSLDPSYASTSVRRTVTPECETVHPRSSGATCRTGRAKKARVSRPCGMSSCPGMPTYLGCGRAPVPSLAMKAFSAISMGSGRTSMQHAAMLHMPTLWSMGANGTDPSARPADGFASSPAQMNTRGSATVSLSSSWGRTTPHTPLHRNAQCACGAPGAQR